MFKVSELSAIPAPMEHATGNRLGLILVFLVSLIVPPAMAEDLPESREDSNSGTGLNLFISIPQQLAMEKSQYPVEDLLIGTDNLQSEEANESPSSNDNSPPSVQIASTELAPTPNALSYPRRYDGAVIKGDRLLGAWFDGTRFTNTANQKFTVDHITRSGRIRLSMSDQTIELVPGDILPGAHSDEPDNASLNSAPIDPSAGSVSVNKTAVNKTPGEKTTDNKTAAEIADDPATSDLDGTPDLTDDPPTEAIPE